jgi:antitoxin HicB
MIKYQAKIYKDGSLYPVEFPDLPGCFTFGETLDEAKVNAREAMSLFLEEARDPKWAVPVAKIRKSSTHHWILPLPEVGIPLLIRQRRLEAELSQSQLAKLLKVTTQQVQKLETPGKSNPTIRTLNKISDVLNASLEIDIAP